MMSSRKQQPKRSRWGGLSIIVYSLVLFAVALSGIATWRRYAQGPQSNAGDAIEGQLDTFLSKLNAPEGWVPAGGFSPRTTWTPTTCFVCPQCRCCCWTRAVNGCPGCPFCGLAMVPRGGSQPGVQISLVGGAGTAGGTAPVPIQAGAQRPHADRGQCSNCHTVVKSGGSLLGQAIRPATQAGPQTLWQAVAAPPIPANARRPTLIRELGMEVSSAQGAGAKITGVMGKSYASNAGLRAGDVIIKCNGANVGGAEQFEQLVAKLPPEADAQVTIMRNGRIRDLSVMVGEGEMEGFGPIQRL